VLSTVIEGDRAAMEWEMDGTAPESGRAFTFRGSDHYEFRDGLICEIRQWWTFDAARLDTGLVGHPSLGVPA
jgi:ketosteroid isomerase-like protein